MKKNDIITLSAIAFINAVLFGLLAVISYYYFKEYLNTIIVSSAIYLYAGLILKRTEKKHILPDKRFFLVFFYRE